MKIISHSQSLSLAICNKLLGIPTDSPPPPPPHNEGQGELRFAQIGTQFSFIASNPDDNASGANPGSHIIKLMGTVNPTPITQKKNSYELPFVTLTMRTETRKPLGVSIHLRVAISPPVQDCRLGMLTLTLEMS